MTSLLNQLQSLSSGGKVAHPEQTILQTLAQFDSVFGQITDDSTLRQLDKSIFNLLRINDGMLSPQCSISLANKMIKIYGKIGESTAATTISDLLNNLTPSSAIAIGRICSKLGNHCLSQLPKVISSVLTMSDEFAFQALYAMYGVYKSHANTLSQYLPQVTKYLFRFIQNTPESSQIMGFKLYKRLVYFDQTLIDNAINNSIICLHKSQTPFVRNEIYILIANCAFLRKKDDFTGAFEVIKMIPESAPQIVHKFMEMIPQESYKSNFNGFYGFLRKYAPSEIKTFISYLPATDRQNMFGIILSESKPSISQISILEGICADEGDIHSTASAALHLARSMQNTHIEFAENYFQQLATQTNSIAQFYLKSAVQILSSCFQSEEIVRANIVVAYAILREKNELAYNIRDLIEKYFENITNIRNVDNIHFMYFWSICSVLPNDLVHFDKLNGPLYQIKEHFNKIQELDEKSSCLLDSITQFYARYPETNYYDDLISYEISQINKLSDKTLYYLSELIAKANRQVLTFVSFMLTKVSNLSPGRKYLKSQINSVVLTADDVLKQSKDEIPSIQQKLAQSFINNFPLYIQNISTNDRESILESIQQESDSSKRMIMNHTILLHLVKDTKTKTMLPRHFVVSILKTLRGTDYLRLQISCEVIANALLNNLDMIEAIFKFIEMNKRAVSCLLLVAIMNIVHLPNSYLSRALLFIDERAFSHFSTPFALHAMTIALKTHPEGISKLDLSDQHVDLLSKLLHDSNSLHPIVLYFLALTYIELLPIAAKHIQGSFLSTVLAILESIKSTPYFISKELSYITTSSICKHTNQYIPIEFPKTKYHSINLIAAATEVSALQNTKLSEEDIIASLLALQVKNDQHFADCVSVILSKQELGFTISLMKSIFINNKIGNVSCNPCSKILYAFIKYMNNSFAALNYINAFPVASSLCYAIAYNSKDILKDAFSLLTKLINKFKLNQLQPQFLAIANSAFELDLSISGGFLSSFITESNLAECFNSLAKCKKYPSTYFTIACRSLSIARELKVTPDYVKQFAMFVAPMMTEIIKTAMSFIYKSGRYNEQAQFQSFVQTFYADLLSVYVFLCSLVPNLIPIKALYSFFALELSSSSDSWKAIADLDGIITILHYFSKEIDTESLQSVLSTAIYNSPLMRGQSEKQIAEIAQHLSKRENLNASAWECLTYSVINIDFKAETAGRVLDHSESAYLEIHITDITRSIFARYESKSINSEQALALSRILLAKIPKLIPAFANSVVEWSQHTANSSSLTFSLLSLCVRKSNDLDYDRISGFCIDRIQRGGLQFLGKSLVQNEEIGIQLISRGAINAAMYLAINNQQYSERFIQFLSLCYTKLDNKELAKAFLQTVVRASNNNPSVVQSCIDLLKKLTKDNELKEIWDTIEEQDRTKCVLSIMSLIH